MSLQKIVKKEFTKILFCDVCEKVARTTNKNGRSQSDLLKKHVLLKENFVKFVVSKKNLYFCIHYITYADKENRINHENSLVQFENGKFFRVCYVNEPATW